MKTKKLDQLFNEVDSRYALVNAVAQRAREISEEAENEGEILIRKPVLIAIDELQKGQTKIVPADSEEAQRARKVAEPVEEAVAPAEEVIDFSEDDDEDDEDEEDMDE